MKLFSYEGPEERSGLLVDGRYYGLTDLDEGMSTGMLNLLDDWENTCIRVARLQKEIESGKHSASPLNNPVLLAPLPHPRSCRDGYAFRQHVETARRNRGLDMAPEFDQFPTFYFTNHQAITGPGEIWCMPDHFQQLDFELEVAVVIGRRGRNIPASEADKYIAGYTIMNDWSARKLQMEEMILSLGPAKGKDFATSIGPWLVTPDELEPYRTATKPGHTGDQFDLPMECLVNGTLVSSGNLKDMDWTFAEIIERCSYGVDLMPGDVIGSGTAGTGCLLELNGTARRKNPESVPQWLKNGDQVTLRVRGLGELNNIVRAEQSEWSILARKK